MRIAFFTNYSSIKAGGIFTYSIGILKMFLAADDAEKIILVYHKEQREYFDQYKSYSKISLIEIDREHRSTKIKFLLSSFLFETYFLYKSYMPDLKLLKSFKRWSVKINPYLNVVKNEKPDVLYFPYQYAQIYGSEIPVVTTLHDVQELHFPEFFDSQERIHRSINTKKSLEEADHIIVSFNHVKNDLMKFFNTENEKISVCLPPLTEDWFTSVESTSKDKLVNKYQLSSPFILYPAATWKHKNHEILIEAIAKLREKGVEINLISTGNKTEYYTKLESKIYKLGIEKYVEFLGMVPEEDLIGLYKSAFAVVIPTLYEAGSGPLFEAMRYGAAAICSNITSIPDTMGNDDYLFDPKNIEELETLLIKILSNEEFKNENINHLKNRLEYFKKIEYKQNFLTAIRKAESSKL